MKRCTPKHLPRTCAELGSPRTGSTTRSSAIYFVVVLGIGFAARRSVKTSLDFFLSGRSLPAWVTGLAFVAANLGATEILGMAANGAQYGVYTVHWYWIGAIPAMVFLGLVMMPFYYGSKVRSVPEFLLPALRQGRRICSARSCSPSPPMLIAGVNLYALAIVVEALLGWPQWVSIVVAGAPMGRDPYAHSGSARYSGTKTSTGVCASDARVNQVKAVPPSNTP